jgi:cytochrome c-type biogenesis protein CcmH
MVLALCLMPLTTRLAAAQTPAPTPAPTPQVTQVAPALGVDTVLDARAKSIASRLRCPVCQGESIQDSPAELAAQMKTLVREQLAQGRSESEVLDYFTQKYGQWILLEPKAQGLNLIVYWVPVLFLAIGGGVLWMMVRRWTRRAA